MPAPKNTHTDPETFADEAPAPAPTAKVGEAAKKPYGQNPGDIVEADQRRGGQYEAIGGGKYRRLADA